jgi:CRP-like cAMP-binding protein
MDTDLLQVLPAGRDRRLAQGEALFRSGDPALGLVLVREGVLELIRTSPEGRRLVLHRAGPGSTFAEASCSKATITATPSPLSRAAPQSTRPLNCAAQPRQTRALGGASPRISRPASWPSGCRPCASPCRTPPTGCLTCCTRFHPEPDGGRRLGRSWKTVAAELGLSHEATYRALARLERAGLLRREGGDRVRLSMVAAE